MRTEFVAFLVKKNKRVRITTDIANALSRRGRYDDAIAIAMLIAMAMMIAMPMLAMVLMIVVTATIAGRGGRRMWQASQGGVYKNAVFGLASDSAILQAAT